MLVAQSPYFGGAMTMIGLGGEEHEGDSFLLVRLLYYDGGGRTHGQLGT